MYTLLEIRAAGAFGTVCVARRPETGEVLALKVMHAAHVGNPKVMARTRDEARLLRQLSHPNIVRVHGLVEPAGRPVIEMELIRGASLDELLEASPGGLPVAESCEIVLRACNGLCYAHETLNLIHRDIKPGNILLDLNGEVKVVDFGIARADVEDREAVTVSQVLGTRAYTAPERLDGDLDRPSGDVFALGLLLYELLTGESLPLSLTLHHHERALSEGVARISPAGVEGRSLEALRRLVSDMVAYFERDRPSHAQCVQRLQQLMALSGLQPNLRALSTRFVQAIYDARPLLNPPQHHAWDEVSFLHLAAENSDIADRLSDFLSEPSWPDNLADLRQLLAAHPSWKTEPFEEILVQAAAPWWFFWRSRPSHSQVEAALDILHHRPTRKIRILAARFWNHRDPRVRERARQLVTLADRVLGA